MLSVASTPIGTVAGTITAIAGVFTGLGLLLTALSVLLPILRETKTIHKIVNQRQTDMLRYQAMLVRELRENGIPIPIDPAIEYPPPSPIRAEEKGKDNGR
jgi:hypothetical protein